MEIRITGANTLLDDGFEVAPVHVSPDDGGDFRHRLEIARQAGPSTPTGFIFFPASSTCMAMPSSGR